MKIRLQVWLMAVVAWSALACALPSSGLAAAADAQSESRLILAMYDSTEFASDEVIPMAEDAELVTDHLGLVLVYWDVSKGLPTHEEMAAYRGVLTYFTDWSMTKPEVYIQWLIDETKLGRYIVVLGNLGANMNEKDLPADPELLSQLYALWGFSYDQENAAEAMMVHVDQLEPDVFSFEHPLTFSEAGFERILPLPDHGVESLMTVSALEDPEIRGAVVAIHPHGGFAFNPFMLYNDLATYRRKWIMNPFRFMARAFRWQTAPRPDITTLDGNRIFFSQLDGDGAVSLCEWERGLLTVEAALRYFKELPLPVTLSVVEGELTVAEHLPWLQSDQRPRAAFKALFALDRVAPASHGYTHPLDWTRGITALKLPPISHKATTTAEKKLISESIYPADSAIFSVPHSVWEEREIVGGINFINTLLPKGKVCKLFLWTGDCEPLESALKICADNGYLNMNGGDGMKDPNNPSYTGLAPAVRHVGPYTQVYTAMANENIYTDDWLRNFGGFYNVVRTFENTETPFRIKPVNVYFHFYSFEKPAAKRAVERTYEWVLKQELSPMFAEQYVRWVLNSREIEFRRDGSDWYWTKAGACRTLRFDFCKLVPDPEFTKGLVGWYYDAAQDCLYLHLDESGEGQVRLIDAAPPTPHVARANGWVTGWQRTPSSVTFHYEGYGRGKVELAGLPPEATLSLTIDGRVQRRSATKDGELILPFETLAFPQVHDVVVQWPTTAATKP